MKIVKNKYVIGSVITYETPGNFIESVRQHLGDRGYKFDFENVSTHFYNCLEISPGVYDYQETKDDGVLVFRCEIISGGLW